MQTSIVRKGANTFGTFAPRGKFDVRFGAFQENGSGWIEYGFETNPGDTPSSRFTGYILPIKFDELAALMLRAHPQAAIRAFGRAMKDVVIEDNAESSATSNAA